MKALEKPGELPHTLRIPDLPDIPSVEEILSGRSLPKGKSKKSKGHPTKKLTRGLSDLFRGN